MTFVAAEANAVVEVRAGDVRVEESDTENALLAVAAAVAAAELGGIFLAICWYHVVGIPTLIV